MLHTLHVQFIKRSYNLAAIISLHSVEQDFVEIQRFEDVDLQFGSLLVRQLFPSFSQNYPVASGEVIPRDLAGGFPVSDSVSVSDLLFLLLLNLKLAFDRVWVGNL